MTLRSRLIGRAIEAYLGPLPRLARRGGAEVVRRLRRDPHTVHFFHRVDDPYSSLLLQALPRLQARFGVAVETVLVGAPAPEANPDAERLAAFAIDDARELARYLNVDFDAVQAPEPPLVARVQEVLLAISDPEALLAAAAAADRALWAGDAAALEALAREHGAVGGHEVRQRLADGDQLLHELGHYQGGMLHYGGEWYWGIDRIGYLAERLAALGAGEAEPPLVARRPGPVPAAAGLTAGGKAVLECYFSFRSPYSYLALAQLPALTAEYNVELVLRPVMPMVRRGLAVPRAKRLYIAGDAAREAARLGIPFGRIADPLPHVERALAIYFAAPEELRPGLALSLTQGPWAEAASLGSNRDLRRLVERAGGDWGALRPALARTDWEAPAEANRQALNDLGLWGVPSFRLGSFRTWGRDRLWLIEAKLAAWEDGHAG